MAGVDGTFWVYGTSDPNSGPTDPQKFSSVGTPTPWSGTGPLFLVAHAVVGGAMRRASIEVKLEEGSGGGGGNGPSSQWNVMCETNPTTQGGHSEGPVLVDGNWSGPYEICQHNFSATVGSDKKVGLYNGGQVSRASHVKKLSNGNNAYVGGNINCTLQMNGNGQIFNTYDQDYFDSEWDKWTQLSSDFWALSGQAINTSDMNNLNVNVSANRLNGNLRVFTIPDSQLKALRTINFSNMTTDDTVVINVTGTNVDWGLQVNATYRDRILWNLPNVSNIKVQNRNWTGFMLAQKANVLQYNNIQGTMVCKNWNTFGAPEMHFTGFKFAGQLNAGNATPSPASVSFKGNYNANNPSSSK